MDIVMNHISSWIIFLPLIGMVLIPIFRSDLAKVIALIATAIQLILTVYMTITFNTTLAGVDHIDGFQFVEKISWISTFHIEYFVGLDGLSLPLIFLTGLLSFLCIIASWNIEKMPKGYFGLFLLLDAGMMGTFLALDFFLFYIFWEIMLLPMYFLIGIWGGPRREYAAIKFFLYTLFGSILMLLGIIALYLMQQPHTFNMLTMIQNNDYARAFQLIVFLAFFIGFAIKLPMFPFHTWLPDAHVEAPTAISVILAGVLLKMGAYGLLRIAYPMFPLAVEFFSFPIAVFGLINMIYGAFCAMAQSDLKKMVAYSSVSHMGYVLLGLGALTPAAMTGAVMQLFNHGTITAMLFLLVGVIYDRAHHRDIDGFGGLATRVPIYTGITSLAFFASLGLPGLSGFWAEVLVFLGAFPIYKGLTICAGLAIILTAAYLLWALQRIFLGPLNEKYKDLEDISLRELATLIPLAVITLILGIYPLPLMNVIRASVERLLVIL